MKYLECYRDIPEPAPTEEEIGRMAEICAAIFEEFCPGAVPCGAKGNAQYVRCDFTLPEGETGRPHCAILTDAIEEALGHPGVRVFVQEQKITAEIARRAVLGLRAALESEEFQTARGVNVVLGRDAEGKIRLCDLRSYGHLLIGGDTGTGKTVFLRSMLLGMFEKYTPAELRVLLFDPQEAEFTDFADCPYLLDGVVHSAAEELPPAIAWANAEAVRRSRLVWKAAQAREDGNFSLEAYNRACAEEDRLPYIVLVIDELSFYMHAGRKRTEAMLCELLQRGRKMGIYVVAATLYLHTEILTGVLRASFPAHICFRTSTDFGSRVVLDSPGAEKLAGSGDFLYRAESFGVLERIKGAYLGVDELRAALAAVREKERAVPPVSLSLDAFASDGDDDDPGPMSEFRASVLASLQDPVEQSVEDEEPPEGYRQALATIIKQNRVSISYLQRACGLGYNHAGRLIDWMERMGYITPFDGTRSRKVILTKEEFEAKYGPLE